MSHSKLSTLQVLCPTMTKEDRETLVALATAGIINWQENDGEFTHVNNPPYTHTHTIDNKWTFWTFRPSNQCVFVCVTDVYGCLAVLLCCLKADTHVEDEVLQAILATVMEWRSGKEDWFLFSR